jgi:hypothetical protein
LRSCLHLLILLFLFLSLFLFLFLVLVELPELLVLFLLAEGGEDDVFFFLKP